VGFDRLCGLVQQECQADELETKDHGDQTHSEKHPAQIASIGRKRKRRESKYRKGSQRRGAEPLAKQDLPTPLRGLG
jgi:hypothetical protein